MSLKDVFEGAITTLGLDIPSHVYGGSAREHREFARMANIAARDIMKSHDWRALRTVATVTGDGSVKAFDLPADYDRRVVDAEFWASDISRSLKFVESSDEWLHLQTKFATSTLDLWTIHGAQVQTYRALANASTGQFYYISNRFGCDSSGSYIAAFASNDDEFRLDDALLEMSLVWRWRKAREKPFEADYRLYTKELNRAIAADKGPRIVRVGVPRIPRDVKISDPERLT